MRLATVCVFLATATLAHAGTRYPRKQVVNVPPVSAPPAPVTSAAPAPDTLALDLIGPAGFNTPPPPGEIARLEAIDIKLLTVGLGDHLFDLGSAYGKQMAFHQRNATAHTAAGNTAKASSELNGAKNMLLRAVRTFKDLVEQPAPAGFTRQDEATYTYGFILANGKYMKEARAVFDRLLKYFPMSQHVPSAHLVFAEYHLEAGQLADADARLRQVLKFPKSSAYWLAMYRLGQVHMLLGRHQEALETFFQVHNSTRRVPALEALVPRARRAFVDAYVPIGKADKALAAFQRVDSAQAHEMLGWLAEAYTKAGAHDKAQIAYTELLVMKPSGPAACEWQAGAARAALASSTSLSTRTGLVETMLYVRARLEAGKLMSASVAARCRADVIAIAGDAARAFHAEAQKTNDPATYAAAAQLYAAYADTIRDAPDVAAMRLLGAEAAWSRADREHRPELWEDAAAAFGAVKTGDAALAAVLAWKNALDVNPSFAVQAGPFDITALPATTLPAVPLDPRSAGLVGAVDVYAATVASQDDEELVRGRFLAATLWRRANHFDRAATILMEVVVHLGRRGDHANRELAANLLLETLARAKQFDRVLVVADGFAADKAFLDHAPTLRRTIDYVRSRSLRRP